MKTDTMLLIAGAIGIGYLIHKNQKAKVTAAETLAAATPRIAALPEPTGSATAQPEVITAAEPTEIYERVGRGGITSWQPNWGDYGRGGGRGRGGR